MITTVQIHGPLSSGDSTTYGVTNPSPLNSIIDFHVVNQLPQDIMHVLFEGVVPHELRFMLPYFVKEKYFSISELNGKIHCYSTHDAGDRPSDINPRIFTSSDAKINQSGEECIIIINNFGNYMHAAAQMWVLSVNLPLIIGDKIPQDSEHWECYLLLLDIIQLCTTRKTSISHAGYPNARVIPKMHYMVHFPQQIIRYLYYWL